MTFVILVLFCPDVTFVISVLFCPDVTFVISVLFCPDVRVRVRGMVMRSERYFWALREHIFGARDKGNTQQCAPGYTLMRVTCTPQNFESNQGFSFLNYFFVFWREKTKQKVVQKRETRVPHTGVLFRT